MASRVAGKIKLQSVDEFQFSYFDMDLQESQ